MFVNIRRETYHARQWVHTAVSSGLWRKVFGFGFLFGHQLCVGIQDVETTSTTFETLAFYR